ncbi:MAG TPA: GNAT family N-acetyltransferase [Dehalococcoidia bacterium]|jgi:GNAT superfamily N-acetyltransferase
MNIRIATRGDDGALRALESRTPLNLGEEKLYLHHDRFFEVHELQDRTVVMLAEEGGEVIGVCAGALVEAPLAGADRRLVYMHHERIAPERQRQGVGGALTRAITDYWKEHAGGHIDSSYWFIAARNSQSISFAERGGTSKRWPLSVYLCTIDGASGDSRAPVRVGAGPTFDIVRLINRTHAGEALFRPYEHVDFGRRLSLSGAYGWGDIYGRFAAGTERLVAVAGTWNGFVADFGYELDAEADMAALIRSMSARSERGLSILLDGRSPLLPALAIDKESQYELLFYAPRIEVPADPPMLHADPAYF